jgi:hypothetical protein
MRKKVYIETSIPSFYHEIRSEPAIVARRDWTKVWWDTQRHNYELVIGSIVIEELEQGNHPSKELTLKLVDDLPILPVEDFIDNILLRSIFLII